MPKVKKHLILNILVVILVFGFVFSKILNQWDSNFIGLLHFEYLQARVYFIFLVLLLALLNWIIEAYKWQFAIKEFQPMGIFSALKTIWYGIGAGLFTPNRIGDPIARVALLPPASRGQGAVMAAVCAMAQQLATILFGLVGIFFFYGYNSVPVTGFESIFAIISVLGLLFITLAVVFKYKNLAIWFQRFKPVQRWLKRVNLSLNAPSKKTMPIVLLSLLRYAVFSSQLLLMMYFFGYNANCTSLYMAIFITYLFASVIPTFAVAEVAVRAGFAITFIGILWPNATGITFATLSLWLINVALPGIIGVWSPFFESKKTA